jgi:hypothetical protein
VAAVDVLTGDDFERGDAENLVWLANFLMGVSFFISIDYAPVHTNLLCRV